MNTIAETTIEADPKVPVIRMSRDFTATQEQLFLAHEGQPDDVALGTLWFEDLGNGRTRLHTQSLVDSFEARDLFLASGMEVGVNEGYAKLDEMIGQGSV